MCIGVFGLGAVAELKRVCDALRSLGCSVKKRSKKADIETAILNVFYSDYPSCTVVNQHVFSLLSSVASSTAAAPTNAASPAAAAAAIRSSQRRSLAPARAHRALPAATRLFPNHQTETAFVPFPIPPQFVNVPGMPASFYNTINDNNNGMHPNGVAGSSPFAMYQTSRLGGSSSSHKKKNKHKRSHNEAFVEGFGAALPQQQQDVYIKPESSMGDPFATPQSDEERRTLGTLQAMGFGDPVEILQSLRRLVRTNKPHSPDDIMCDILSMRDEKEEAKKMDEARQLSEASRKEDAKQRRLELQKQLRSDIEQADCATWKSDSRMFPHSWILENVGRIQFSLKDADTKRLMVDLLELEKKAFKWYGQLPKAYFMNLVGRLPGKENCSGAPASALLSEIMDTLRTAMFELSEQTGGVPKVFRNARDEYEKSNPDAIAVVRTITKNKAAQKSHADIIDLS